MLAGSSWLFPSLPRTLLTSLSALPKIFLITFAAKFLLEELACLSFTSVSESIGTGKRPVPSVVFDINGAADTGVEDMEVSGSSLLETGGWDDDL